MLRNKVEKPEDLNPVETQEWLEALDQVIEEGGPERARYLLERLAVDAATKGVPAALGVTTPYLNTIAVEEEVPYPGDRELERRIKSLVRWNAVAMVVRANKYDDGIGGAHFHVRVVGDAIRSGHEPFLPRIDSERNGRPAWGHDLFPGACFAGHVFARFSGRAPDGRALEEFPA